MVYIALICQEYHWTYDEYMNQPVEFLDAIDARRKVEDVIEKKQDNKMKAELARARNSKR